MSTAWNKLETKDVGQCSRVWSAAKIFLAMLQAGVNVALLKNARYVATFEGVWVPPTVAWRRHGGRRQKRSLPVGSPGAANTKTVAKTRTLVAADRIDTLGRRVAFVLPRLGDCVALVCVMYRVANEQTLID